MIDDLGWRELINIASNCGFIIFEGGKHTKVKTKKGEFITTIPRHHKLSIHLVGGVLKKVSAIQMRLLKKYEKFI